MPTSRPHILIIDASEDSCEVMQTALDRRGFQATTAGSQQQGLAAASQSGPRILVVDAESLPDTENGCQKLVLWARARQAPIVWLGDEAADWQRDAPHRFRKPYHYAALLRKIEQLLSADAPLCGARLATSRGARKAA